MRPYFPIIMLAYVLAPCLAASEILVGSASVEICVSQLIILLYLCSRQVIMMIHLRMSVHFLALAHGTNYKP